MANFAVSFVKRENTKLHLILATVLVVAAAMAVRKAVFVEANPLAVIAAAAAAWLVYSFAVAGFAAKDFGTAFQKALVLDSLTYLPMLLPLLVKIAVAGINLPKYMDFVQLPVTIAFGAAVAANIAGKIVLFPKNIDARLESPLFSINRKTKIVVTIAIILYFFFFAVVTVMKHSSFNSTAFDLAIFDKTLWGYSNGEILFNTVRGLNLLADHMQPILFLFAPLYKFMPMPEALLVLQSLALAVGALPIYWIARKRIGAAAAAMISASYLIYPSLQYINLFDFHPEAFATPLLLFAIYFIDAKKYAAAIVMLILTGFSKEHFPLALASIGAYVFLSHKKRLLGAAMAAAGFLWFAINFKVLLPYFFGDSAYAHIIGYEYLGNTVTEAAKNAILHPQLIITQMLAADKATYLSLLSLPLGFATVVILGLPYLLLAAPFLAINLLRAQDLTAAVIYQHNAELIPFIYFAAIIGSQQLIKLLKLLKLSNTRAAVGAFVFLTTVTAAATYGPFVTIYDVKQFFPSEHARIGQQLINEIPKNSAVSADSFLLPHLAQRREAYMFPNPFVTFMFGKNPWELQNGTEEGQGKVEYVFIDLSRVSPTYNASMYEMFIAGFLNNNNYGLIKFEDSYAVFKKGEKYGKGLCILNDYFATSTASAVKVDLKKALKNESGKYLKSC